MRRAARRRRGCGELFGPKVWSITWRALLICGVSLTAHWAFLFWQQKHIRRLAGDRDARLPPSKNHAAVVALFWIMIGSLIGNYLCGALAKWLGYRRAISLVLAAYFLCMFFAFGWPWSYQATLRMVVRDRNGAGGVRPVHDVPAAAVPHPAAHHGRGVLLQFRAHSSRRVAPSILDSPRPVRWAIMPRRSTTRAFCSSRRRLIALLLPEEKDEDGEVNLLAD